MQAFALDLLRVVADSSIFDPHVSLYTTGWARIVVYTAATLAAVGGGATVLAALHAWKEKNRNRMVSLAAAWAVIPPIWFWFDYTVLYRSGAALGSFEYFKYGQQVSTATWAGIALTLAATSTSDHFK